MKWLQEFYFKNYLFRRPRLNYFRVFVTIAPFVLLALAYTHFQKMKQIEILEAKKQLFENQYPTIEITKTIYFDDLGKKGKAKVTLVENKLNISAVFESTKIEPGTYSVYLVNTCDELNVKLKPKNIPSMEKNKIINFRTFSGDAAMGDSSSYLSLLASKHETSHVAAVAIYNSKPLGKLIACKSVE